MLFLFWHKGVVTLTVGGKNDLAVLNLHHPSITRMRLMDKVLLDHNGHLTARPAAMLKRKIDPDDLRAWCHIRGVYGLPTLELVECLRDLTKGATVVEIGAGTGSFGRQLGWTMTDNKMQSWPEIQAYYTALGQPTIQYPADVLEMDAHKAVAELKPDIVFGSWITQWIDPEKPPPPGGGNMYGVKEEWLLDHVETYIMYGNERVHGEKLLLQRPHRIIKAPWMLSRALNPTGNCLYIWSRK